MDMGVPDWMKGHVVGEGQTQLGVHTNPLLGLEDGRACRSGA